MIWFLLAAAVALGAFDWSGGGGSRRYWVAALAAFGLFCVSATLQSPGAAGECPPEAGTLCRSGFLSFAALYVCSTALLGIGSLHRRISVRTFTAFAISDLALLFAVWVRYGETSVWSLPPVGGWGAASTWGAAAALLRLAAPVMAPARSERPAETDGQVRGGRIRRLLEGAKQAPQGALLQTGLSSVGWWQGALLAWWLGGGGGAVSIAGGLVLWPLAAFRSRDNAGAALASAGGLVAIAAALSVPPPGLAATGLAGVAMLLGEPVLGLWVLGALPLSVLTSVDLPSVFDLSAAAGRRAGAPYSIARLGCAVLLPVAWAVAAARLGPSHRSGAGTTRARAGALLASAAAAVVAMAAFPRAGQLAWALAGAGLAALAAGAIFGRPLLTGAASAADGRPPDGPPAGFGREPGEPPSTGRGKGRFLAGLQPAPGWGPGLIRTAPGWAVLLGNLVVLGWLVLKGLQTGFL